MRAIDGDALKDRLQSLAYDDWNQGVTTSWADAYRECADIVENTPTITPERKRGRWIDAVVGGELPVIVCDQCNTFFPLQFGASHNFCPHCGSFNGGNDEE